MKAVILTTCDSPVEAHFIKHRLENANIYCYLTNENMSTLLPFAQFPVAGFGVSVFVREKDLEKALKIMNESRADE